MEEKKKERKRKTQKKIFILAQAKYLLNSEDEKETRWKKGAEKDRRRFLLRFRFHILARAKSRKEERKKEKNTEEDFCSIFILAQAKYLLE